MVRCTKHPDDRNCYNYCRDCEHCDNSYKDNPNLECDCDKCECLPELLAKRRRVNRVILAGLANVEAGGRD